MLKQFFQVVLDWYQHALETGGYWVVGLLMTMESSVLPLPSESIIPLAASWSHSGKIHIGIPGIIVAGALGSWLGATIVYWLARLAGRPLLMRYGT
jgi:membrane protein DedA with SNARE-associated domain